MNGMANSLSTCSGQAALGFIPEQSLSSKTMSDYCKAADETQRE
jgi:hypothetical protein